MKKSDKDLANDIRRRANAANVSISKLCREAGVSRQWYEDLKRRTPQPVDLYLKIDEKLKEYERGKAATHTYKTSFAASYPPMKYYAAQRKASIVRLRARYPA